MLLVAVTGGIGSGKSTVSARLGSLGAVVVDSDQLAREVVAPGSTGLAEIVERFGTSVVDAAGALDRAALARIVFADPAERRALEAITHPKVRQRFLELAARAPDDAVVVNDIPILTDRGVAVSFHLVIGVGVDANVRLRRLIGRGMTEQDARARIAAQIDEATRRRLTDVWLDNNDDLPALYERVDALYGDRLAPFEANLRAGRPARPAPAGEPSAAPADLPTVRVIAALQAAGAAVDVDPAAGPMSGPELRVGHSRVIGPAAAAVTLRLRLTGTESGDRTVDPLDPPGEVTAALRHAGFVPAGSGEFRSADPGCPLVVRLEFSPG